MQLAETIRSLAGITCSGCNTPGRHLCNTCLESAHSDANRAPHMAVLPDIFPWNRLVRAAKFQGVTAPLPALVQLTSSTIDKRLAELGAPDIAGLCPVPPHRPRSQWRGTDIPAFMARRVARLRGCRTFQLFHRTQPRMQRGQARAARLANARDGFVLKDSRPMTDGDRPVVIIDDITTTGATLSTLSGMLAEQDIPVIAVALTGVDRKKP